MKNCLFLIAVILTNLNSGAKADQVWVEDFVGGRQLQSNWCWAACIQSILASRGLQISQPDIVRSAYGVADNRTAPGFQGTLRILNGLTMAADGSVWTLQTKAVPTFPNADWLRMKLKKNQPVMIWYNDGISNHAIVVTAGQYYLDGAGRTQWQLIRAYDPWIDSEMTIDGANIPKYVYGVFDIQFKKDQGPPSEAPSLSKFETSDDDSNDDKAPPTPFGFKPQKQ